MTEIIMKGAGKRNVTLGVIIGRFQPIHDGHRQTLFSPALKECDEVLVLLGSCNVARSPKNPFTPEERIEYILASLAEGVNLKDRQGNQMIPSNFESKLRFAETDDFMKDLPWAEQIHEVVRQQSEAVSQFHDRTGQGLDVNIRLYGARKKGDQSTYYLGLFPEWEYRACNVDGNTRTLNATDVRDALFRGEDIETYVGGPVSKMVLENEALPWLRKEYDFYRSYLAPYEEFERKMNHGHNFITVDAVVFHRSHVLLVKRGRHPGKGLYALPGGHLDKDREAIDCAIKECKEETSIRIKRADCFVERVFSNPSRSLRGRTMTIAYGFHIPFNPNGDNDLDRCIEVKNPKGGDDAAEAMWVPISRVLNDKEFRQGMFEDHHLIIQEIRSKLDSMA